MKLVDRVELQKYLRCKTTQIKKYIRAGLPFIIPPGGGRQLYDLDAVDAWLTRDQRPVEQPEPTKRTGKGGKRKGPDVKACYAAGI